MDSTEAELIDLIDLIDYTLSDKFIQSWRYKYSEKFIRQFQLKLLSTLKDNKPIKIKTLTYFLRKNNKYSIEQIINFYKSININLYSPIIQGNLNEPF
jgi:hypothetical protein